MRTALQKARKKRNLTHKQVADYLGMIKQSYEKIEYGTRGTSENNWLKIFDLFEHKIPLHELMENKYEEEKAVANTGMLETAQRKLRQ